MNLTERERKLLWTRAGNYCSYRLGNDICDQLLSITEGGKQVVVGIECHIVGEKEGAARYVADFSERESYTNAILLCPIHHKLIDDLETRALYPVEIIKTMKQSHEHTITQRKDIIITNSEFLTEAKDTDRATGMEIAAPTSLSNVKVGLKVQNVKEAIGVKVNQSLNLNLTRCSACGNPIPMAYTGLPPITITCPRCGHEETLSK